jgi:hydrogenase large subunit
VPNYLVFGDLPANGIEDVDAFKFPRGIILDRNLSEVIQLDASDPEQIQEQIAHSYYDYTSGESRHPWEGETNLHYTGPEPPYESLTVDEKYSWLKTPRWKGKAMEVGPLARMLVGYASGRNEFVEQVDRALAELQVPVDALFSTLGRTAARGLETVLVAGWAQEFYDALLANIKSGDQRTFNNEFWEPESWPSHATGVGLSEAPRGALSHWIVIRDGRIENYQMVVPSTWNASPRDMTGQLSAYEAALIGTPVADPDLPLEILRTIHSFDPCIACAVHLYDEHGSHVHQVNTF